MMFFVIFDIMGLWTYFCIREGRFLEIPYEAIALVGAMVAGKVGQKFAERNEVPPKSLDKTFASFEEYLKKG
jgi:uncharacterized membrane protein YfcA